MVDIRRRLPSSLLHMNVLLFRRSLPSRSLSFLAFSLLALRVVLVRAHPSQSRLPLEIQLRIGRPLGLWRACDAITRS
jgi:hypothetical protein